MTLGLDTSVVLRLLTGQPPDQFGHAASRLAAAHAAGEPVVVSDLVIAGERGSGRSRFAFGSAGVKQRGSFCREGARRAAR